MCQSIVFQVHWTSGRVGPQSKRRTEMSLSEVLVTLGGPTWEKKCLARTVGALDGGSPNLHVDFKKRLRPLSLLQRLRKGRGIGKGGV